MKKIIRLLNRLSLVAMFLMPPSICHATVIFAFKTTNGIVVASERSKRNTDNSTGEVRYTTTTEKIVVVDNIAIVPTGSVYFAGQNLIVSEKVNGRVIKSNIPLYIDLREDFKRINLNTNENKELVRRVGNKYDALRLIIEKIIYETYLYAEKLNPDGDFILIGYRKGNPIIMKIAVSSSTNYIPVETNQPYQYYNGPVTLTSTTPNKLMNLSKGVEYVRFILQTVITFSQEYLNGIPKAGGHIDIWTITKNGAAKIQ